MKVFDVPVMTESEVAQRRLFLAHAPEMHWSVSAGDACQRERYWLAGVEAGCAAMAIGEFARRVGEEEEECPLCEGAGMSESMRKYGRDNAM